MLVNRTYRNNLGYQIEIDRPHPVFAEQLERINKNVYDYDGFDTKMGVLQTSEHGMQYGGKRKGLIRGGGSNFETVNEVAKMLYTGSKKALDFYSSETGTVIKNKYGEFMNNNANWRSGFVGERHLLNSRGLTFNYLGPNTALKERLARGDPPLDGPNGLDMAAKIHDIEYSRAKTWKDVRKADVAFVKNVEKSNANNKSKKVIKGLFKAKMIGEDAGLVKPSDFTSFPNIQDEIPKQIQSSQPSVNISGQGNLFRSNQDPARKLKQKVRSSRRKKKVDKLLSIAVSSINKKLRK